MAGGGRYDGLIEEMGGNPTPAGGFATGLERVLMALEKLGRLPDKSRSVDVYVVALGEAAQEEAFKLVMELRDAGFSAAVDYAGRSMKAQMKQANKLGARYAAIMGEDELAEGVVMLRDMAGSEQEKVPVSDIINKVK